MYVAAVGPKPQIMKAENDMLKLSQEPILLTYQGLPQLLIQVPVKPVVKWLM